MAVKIRLRRMGAKKRPFYRFVVTDSRMPRDGRFIEFVGYYHPLNKPAIVEVKEEKIWEWLKKGAQLSGTVEALFRNIGLLKKWAAIKKGEDVSSLIIVKQLKERKRSKKRKVKEKTVTEVKAETKTEAKT